MLSLIRAHQGRDYPAKDTEQTNELVRRKLNETTQNTKRTLVSRICFNLDGGVQRPHSNLLGKALKTPIFLELFKKLGLLSIDENLNLMFNPVVILCTEEEKLKLWKAIL